MKHSFTSACAFILLMLNGTTVTMYRQPLTKLLVNKHNRLYTNSFDVKSSQFTTDQKRKPQDEVRSDEKPYILTLTPNNPQEDKMEFYKQWIKNNNF